MGNAAGSMEVPQGKESKSTSAPPASTGSQKQTAGLKLPMPPEEELEQRFSAVLVSCCHSVQQVTSTFTHKRKEHRANGREKQRMWNM